MIVVMLTLTLMWQFDGDGFTDAVVLGVPGGAGIITLLAKPASKSFEAPI